MSNKLPTAEEFYSQNMGSHKEESLIKGVYNTMIEFARLHVEAALKAALEDIPCLGSSTDIASYEEVEDAVLNAYPLTNIK